MADAKTISGKALALLETLGCAPTPMAYAVAYAYVEDPEGPVARDVMGEVARRRGLRAAAVERVHASHLAPAAPDLGTAARIGRRLDEAIGLMGASVASTQEATDRIAAAADAGAVGRILQDVIATQEDLHQNLKAKNDELDLLRQRYEKTLEESRRDPLTGLANRRAFDERLAEAIREAEESGRPLSLLVGDIDHFKGINDAYGHHTGDQIIKLIGKTLRAAVRADDMAARLGGEEYAVILPGAELDRAAEVAERVRDTVDRFRRLATASDGSQRKVTLSLGVAEAAPGDDATSLYVRADGCLYAAKRAGRNRVVTEAALRADPDAADVEAPGP